MKTKSIITLLSVLIISLNSCKKDSTEETTTPTPVTPVDNTVCEGKTGVTSFFPLAQGNQWVYKRNYFASGNPLDSSTVDGTQVYNSVTYMKIREYQGVGSSTVYRYYRVASNGDVYFYEYGSGIEYLLIPATPTLNQMLGADPTHYGTTRKVTSLTASLTTSTCTYTNLMVIENYGMTGGLVSTVYYKKGMGFVKDGDFQVIQAKVN